MQARISDVHSRKIKKLILNYRNVTNYCNLIVAIASVVYSLTGKTENLFQTTPVTKLLIASEQNVYFKKLNSSLDVKCLRNVIMYLLMMQVVCINCQIKEM